DYLKSKIVDDDMYYFLLDEVQLIYDKDDSKNKSAFYEVINSLMHIENTDIYVTGSNSQFLSKDVLTVFRGRGMEVHVYPLSFSEYMENKDRDYNNINKAWNDYFTYGGLPMTSTLTTDELKTDYLNSIFDEIYMLDLKDRYKIKNKIEFDELIDVVSSQVGSYASYNSLSNTFKSLKNKQLSQVTIEKYLRYLESAFILNKAPKYDIKGKKYIGAYNKYYFEDLGLRNVRLNFKQVEETHLMENIIYNELLYRGFSVNVGVVEKVEKNNEGKQVKKQLEVDFVCNKGSMTYYVQSALSIIDEEKRDREIKSLKNIKDSFKRIVITKDDRKVMHDDNGITYIGLYECGLNENSLD
ncbi:MAG: ATP-binding protein, partial [archaeon]|nr:ATP-binding protein [archaeon]